MLNRKTLKRHADLLDRMAGQVGLDLEEEVYRGRMQFDEIADAVLRCTGCSNPDHCAGWLDTAEAREDPPGYCRNASLFRSLKPDAP